MPSGSEAATSTSAAEPLAATADSYDGMIVDAAGLPSDPAVFKERLATSLQVFGGEMIDACGVQHQRAADVVV